MAQNIKPSLFIGCSTEALDIAKTIKNKISDEVEVTIWSHGTFQSSGGVLQTLMSTPGMYDFGLLLLTPDDKVEMRKENESTQQYSVARDNVLFEYGLFLGQMGQNRTLILKEESVDLPTDFLPKGPKEGVKDASNIATAEFNLIPTPTNKGNRFQADPKSLKEACDKLLLSIQEKNKSYDFRFIPSTALAISYFNNFLFPVIKKMLDNSENMLKEHRCKKFCFHLLLPKNITAPNWEINEWAKIKFNLDSFKVPGNWRSFEFYRYPEEFEKGVLHVADVPTVLTTLHTTVENYIGGDKQKGFKEKRSIEEKELRNFELTINKLIEAKSLPNGIITIDRFEIGNEEV